MGFLDGDGDWRKMLPVGGFLAPVYEAFGCRRSPELASDVLTGGRLPGRNLSFVLAEACDSAGGGFGFAGANGCSCGFWTGLARLLSTSTGFVGLLCATRPSSPYRFTSELGVALSSLSASTLYFRSAEGVVCAG